MSQNDGEGREQDLEAALLRRAILSSAAATHSAFEALVVLSAKEVADPSTPLQQAIERGMQELSLALKYVEEAQNVSVRP